MGVKYYTIASQVCFVSQYMYVTLLCFFCDYVSFAKQLTH